MNQDPIIFDGEMPLEKKLVTGGLSCIGIAALLAYLRDDHNIGEWSLRAMFWFTGLGALLLLLRMTLKEFIEIQLSRGLIVRVRVWMSYFRSEKILGKLNQIEALEMERTKHHFKHASWYQWAMAMRLHSGELYCLGPSVGANHLLREYKNLMQLAKRLQLTIKPLMDSFDNLREGLTEVEEAVSMEPMRGIDNEVNWSRILVPIVIILVFFVWMMSNVQ